MKKRLNLSCYITMALLGLYLAGYQNVIDSIRTEYAVNNAIMGFIIALHFIGSVTAPIFFGELSDRRGIKPVVLIAFSILIGGLFIAVTFKGILALALGIFLIGGGFSVIEGTLSTLLSNANPGETIKVINLSQMFFGIGAVLGPLLALFIVNQFHSWRALFGFLSFLFILMLVTFARLEITDHVAVEEKSGMITTKLLSKKNFLLLCFSMFLYVGIEEGIAFWMTTFFDLTYNSALWGTYALSAYWSGMIIGRFIGGIRPQKSGVFLSLGTFISTISIILALIIKNEIVGFICFLLVGLGFSITWPVIISVTSERFEQYKGTAVGIMMSSGALGGSTLPFLIGAVGTKGQIKSAFWSFPLIIVAIYYSILRSQRKED